MIFTGSFSTDTRFEIKKRSAGKSELSGISGEELICGHLFHDKTHAEYDSPEMGLRITKFEECAYHKLHIDCPEVIGMEDNQNKSVIASYMAQFSKSKIPLEEVIDKVGTAIDDWKGFLKGQELKHIEIRSSSRANSNENAKVVSSDTPDKTEAKMGQLEPSVFIDI